MEVDGTYMLIYVYIHVYICICNTYAYIKYIPEINVCLSSCRRAAGQPAPRVRQVFFLLYQLFYSTFVGVHTYLCFEACVCNSSLRSFAKSRLAAVSTPYVGFGMQKQVSAHQDGVAVHWLACPLIRIVQS